MRKSGGPARRGRDRRKATPGPGKEAASAQGRWPMRPAPAQARMTDGPEGEVTVSGAVVCLAEAGGWGAF